MPPWIRLVLVAALGVGACQVPLAERAARGDPRAQLAYGRTFLHDAAEPSENSATNRTGARWIRRAAEQGDVEAEVLLGQLYYRGQGVPQDFERSEAWTRKAALAGDAQAQGFLGGLYRLGRGVPADLEKSIYWYERAATGGDPHAAYFLGAAREAGAGLPRDRGQAIRWYQRAAEKGHSEAPYRLALLYLAPADAEADAPEGAKWLMIASRFGSQQGSAELLEAQKRLSIEDLDEGLRRANAWFEQNAAAAAP